MYKFPKELNIPLGDWVDTAMTWVMDNWGDFFDALGDTLLQLLIWLEKFFIMIPWPVTVIGVGLLGWRLLGSWKRGLVLSAMLMVIGCFGYWKLTMMTLALVTGAVVISLATGIPIGIWMAKSDRAETAIKPILDAMQTMPSFVYLIPVMMLFGLGKVPAIFATIIYSMPPIIRLTNVGIREVPKEVVEAARAFGATPMQTLFKVQLPLACPTIVVGVNQTTMMALAMVVVASMIGAKGLGMEVLIAINRIDIGKGFEAGLSIVFLAIIIDRLTHAVAVRNTKR
ncbi:ABC transporter permease subunit [Pseudodesulfovibrio sp. JC047]|uniref:ABC transporter permease n=1 Tax=Pseudodesulfovibrio sp. JC047 TaxID=2683199 RepID=UPI0013D67C8D|nr:proline/glycine betaine ABC transporter permease [Pseudodesulfovibrio sp. JC047]NDV20806.1 ABC transporter permease subunit [Pseudodesulfovibrio sp. JC047]